MLKGHWLDGESGVEGDEADEGADGNLLRSTTSVPLNGVEVEAFLLVPERSFGSIRGHGICNGNEVLKNRYEYDE
jgi:hypothetical protein